MKRTLWNAGGTMFLALAIVAAGRAQMNQTPAPAAPPAAPDQAPTGQLPSGQLPGQTPSTGQAPAAGQPATPAPPPVNPAEEAAFKAFFDMHGTDPAKQIQMGEDFAKTYPASRYLPGVYSTLALDYMTTGASDKIIPTAQKSIDIDPNNVDALSLIVWASARTLNPSAPGAADQFVKIDTYAHHDLDLLTAMTKPAGIDDAQFTVAKNDDLSMCYSGLGVIDFKRQKYDASVAELTQAVQLSETPDPVDYFMLGHADEATSHFTDAMSAFSKCTDQGPLQDRCKAGLDDAKQKALEAPAPKS